MNLLAPVRNFVKALLRRKYIDNETVTRTELSRCLSTYDLTFLGIGSTLGAGIYVLAGQVALEKAGPAVVLSFLIAAVAAVLAGLCYAEFGARVPKTGSAYVYSYVTVGEFAAFVIGWNLILEYVIGSASVARAWSDYFNSMIDDRITIFFREHMPMNISGLSPYPDFFAFAITFLLAVILAMGVKESARFNTVFTCVNLLVVVYVIICGLFKADGSNWKIPQKDVPPGRGTGGFMPYGISGVLTGAATCFYGFVGFDCIATTGEEVKNPRKAIPLSISISLLVIFLAYFTVSTVLTLMVPYFLLDRQAPLPLAFERAGWGVAKYIISVGGIAALSTSLMGAMFPLPRVLYAMATDGLIFRFMSHIYKRFKTPFLATIISGLFAGGMAMLFDVTELVNMMSIGTLLAYTLVAICVLILRYKVQVFEPPPTDDVNLPRTTFTKPLPDTTSKYMTDASQPGAESVDRDLLNEHSRGIDSAGWSTGLIVKTMFCKTTIEPTPLSQRIAIVTTCILSLLLVVFAVMLIFGEEHLSNHDWWPIALSCLFGALIIVGTFVIWRQPQNKTELTFKVPCVPFSAIISIFVNVYLMLKLPVPTWIRFAVWMAIGFAIYFGYGIWKSSERERPLLVASVRRSTYGSTDANQTPSSPLEKTIPVDGDEIHILYG